jgi:hypothetical protein
MDENAKFLYNWTDETGIHQGGNTNWTHSGIIYIHGHQAKGINKTIHVELRLKMCTF